MLKPKTVFVLGAGASCEFGLPSGEQLKGIISSKLDIRFDEDGYRQIGGDLLLMDVLRTKASNEQRNVNDFIAAAWRVRDAMPQSLSIDNYLDAHRNDSTIAFCGKLAIAQTIAEAEKGCFLSPKPPKQRVKAVDFGLSWLIPFSQRLTEGVRLEDLPNLFAEITFAVFNYDRCLETALLHILQNYYSIGPQEAAAIVGEAQIYHPYGSLGRLPWQLQSQCSQTVEFGPRLGARDIVLVSDRIRTFTEQLEDQTVGDRIKQAFGLAEKIVFLGFGLHSLNMEVLAAENKQVYEIYGTVDGLSSSDVRVIERVIRSTIKRADLPVTHLFNGKCNAMLNQFGREICF